MSAGAEDAAPATVEAVPAGTRIVHIGAAKTGTTSVQAAFAAAREQLAGLGVLYPGTGANHKAEMDRLLANRPGGALERLRTELAQHPEHRVLLSAERLAHQLAPGPQRVRELVGERAHVVLTLRSVADFLASMWQQEVKSGEVRDLDTWTRERLEAIDSYNLLRRDDGTGVARRWVREFGPEHVTVVVLERSSPGRLFEVFEGLCGLPAGTLRVSELNRGLTWTEAELVRAVNVRIAASGAAERADLRRLVHLGIVSGIVRDWSPEQGEARPVLPAWARAQVVEVAARLGDDVRASGARVVGDLAELERFPTRDMPGPVGAVPTGLLDAALHGLVRRTAAMTRRRSGRP